MKRRSIVLALILSMAIVFFAGCANQNDQATKSNGQNKQDTYTPVKTTQVVRKTLANTTTISGRVSADKDVMVLPEVPGTVKNIAVKEGEQVKEGDVLFTLDEEDIQKQVDQAKAAYDMAKANYNMNQQKIGKAKESFERTLDLADSTLTKARENVDNIRQLYEAGGVSKDQLDQAELALQQQEVQMQAQIDQAEMAASDQVLEAAGAQLKQAELAYKQAQDALKNAAVTAPIDGVVTGISIQAGGMASNAQPAMNIVDMNRVYVTVQVVEGIVNQLKQGQEVNITIPAVSSEAFNAVIDIISPAVDARTQLYPVKIYLENTDGQIKPGMFANVEIALDVRENVLAVPSDAVLVKDERNVVYTIEDDKAVEKEAKIGLDTGSETEILEGLKENDIIIINGQHYIEDGGTVKIVGEVEAEDTETEADAEGMETKAESAELGRTDK